MPNELYYQTQLINDAKKIPNAFAIKLTNRHLAGVPDLMIKIPNIRVAFAETKVANWKDGSKKVKVETTPLQRSTMKKMVKAGFKCGVWVIRPFTKYPELYRLDPFSEYFDPTMTNPIVRDGGWDMVTLCLNPTGEDK